MEECAIVLAGGSPYLQSGIVAALERDRRVRLVLQSRDVCDAANRLTQLACDVFVVYADEPHVEAERTLHCLPDGWHRTKLLVLTDNEDFLAMLATLRLGIRGYGILNQLGPQDLRAATFVMARGGPWTCPWTTHQLFRLAMKQPAPNSIVPPHDNAGLSSREIEVLQLTARGAAEQEVADALCLSRNTVKTYLRRICDKLDVPTRAKAVTVGFQLGLVPDRRTRTIVVRPPALPGGAKPLKETRTRRA